MVWCHKTPHCLGVISEAPWGNPHGEWNTTIRSSCHWRPSCIFFSISHWTSIDNICIYIWYIYILCSFAHSYYYISTCNHLRLYDGSWRYSSTIFRKNSFTTSLESGSPVISRFAPLKKRVSSPRNSLHFHGQVTCENVRLHSHGWGSSGKSPAFVDQFPAHIFEQSKMLQMEMIRIRQKQIPVMLGFYQWFHLGLWWLHVIIRARRLCCRCMCSIYRSLNVICIHSQLYGNI